MTTTQRQIEFDTQEQRLRASYYYLLSRFLCSPPSTELLSNIAALGNSEPDESSGFAIALSQLSSAAAQASDLEALDDEYHALFVGLGRGELLPYASWYSTGMLMDKPLSLVREDLKALGMERVADNKEPEDHIAALFDIMGMMIESGDEFQFKAQQTFFDRHLRSWVRRFFKDLQNARTAKFYKNVGKFGLEFADFEAEYLSMPT